MDGPCAGELLVAPGDRAVDRDVELEDSGPVAVPAKLIGVASGQPLPAMASNGAGLRSKSTARCGGRSAMSETRVSGRISPPAAIRAAASASASRWEPPVAIGQPNACAAVIRTRAGAPLAGSVRRSAAWAATPATSARERSSLNLRASDDADWTACRPNHARRSARSGRRGTWNGARMSGTSDGQRRTSGPNNNS